MDAIGKAAPFSLFISDLHLCSSRPRITEQFLTVLKTSATQAEYLFILGDFFEYWAGDDDIGHANHAAIVSGLQGLSQSLTKIYFMHGNRDFLIGEAFAKTTGINLLNDPSVFELYGKRVLITHGDALCTDDVAYQQFRQQVRQPAWQQQFLAQPLADRKAQIEALRMRSESEKSSKLESIMDVNAASVAELIRANNYPEILIHGHTHRPAKHVLEIDHHVTERWVLGDWYEQGSCLCLDASGCHNIPHV